jgi:5-methylcytosine-specific restriction endonuclease McrA
VRPRSDPLPCCLCERPFLRGQLTKHHCLPREKGGTAEDVELLCRQCHGMVHATYTNRTLAAMYPTLAKLREAPELEPFLRWVRKQPPSRRTRNLPRRNRI